MGCLSRQAWQFRVEWIKSWFGCFCVAGSYFARDAAYSHVYTDRPSMQPSVLPVSLGRISCGLGLSIPYPGATGLLFPYPTATPSTSTGVTSPTKPHTHAMFLARVLVGHYTRGHQNIRKPPPYYNEDPYGKSYDSTVDNVMDPRIYVIFDSSQCYPEYLIHYSNELRAPQFVWIDSTL